jgi:hypothetical protein
MKFLTGTSVSMDNYDAAQYFQLAADEELADGQFCHVLGQRPGAIPRATRVLSSIMDLHF